MHEHFCTCDGCRAAHRRQVEQILKWFFAAAAAMALAVLILA